MRLYIVGTVASGKTTLAKKISEKTKIECTHLDGVVHIKDKTNKEWGNTRRTEDEIDKLFGDIISRTNWIIEDAGRKMFSEGLEAADVIVYLNPSMIVRKKRILTRHIKQKLGLEKSLYTPSILMVKSMYKWIKNGNNELETSLIQFKQKIIVLRNNNEIDDFIAKMPLSD